MLILLNRYAKYLDVGWHGLFLYYRWWSRWRWWPFGRQTPQTGFGGELGLGQGAGLGGGLGGTNASRGLFGNRPTGGLLSTATSQGDLGGGGLFGQTPQSQTQGTGGLFGNPTFGIGGLGTGTVAGGLFHTPTQGEKRVCV